MQLVPFEQNGLELVINTETGEAFASASAIARMMSTDDKTIHPKQISSYGNTLIQSLKIGEFFEAQIQTGVGLRSVKLYDEKAIREFAKKYNVDLLDKFADAGIRVYLHTLAGYQVRSTAVQPEKVVQPQLPARSVIDYVETYEKIEAVNNLTLRELFRDELIDELSVRQGKKQLLGQTEKKEYTIAKVRARELGYTTKEIGNGSGLGRYIAKNVPLAFTERVGKYEVKHYEICDRLDTQIHAYFGMRKSLIAK